MNSLSDQSACVATKADGTTCGAHARFVYQVIDGHIEPLCGTHARHFEGSPNLKPAFDEDRKP